MGGPALNGLDAIAWVLIPTPWVHVDPKPFEVAYKLRGMISDDLAVAEECFHDLRELFVGYYDTLAEAAPIAVPFLVEILAHEEIVGRAYAGQLLVEIASLACRKQSDLGDRCLEALHARRQTIDAVSQAPAGAHTDAARMVLKVLDGSSLDDSPAALERLSNAVHVEERARSAHPSLPPGADEIATWLVDLRSGKMIEETTHDRDRQLTEMALYLSSKARQVDCQSMLDILEARRPPPAEGENAEQRRDTQVRWSLSRAAALAKLGQHQEAIRQLDELTWGYSTQSSALTSAEHDPGSTLTPALLARVTDPSLRVRRKVVEARHAHRMSDWATVSGAIQELAHEWLQPAAVNQANQVLDRRQMLELLGLLQEQALHDALAEKVRAAPEPEIAIPDGDTI